MVTTVDRIPEEVCGAITDANPTNTGTSVEFTNEGLVRDFECYEDCAHAWTFFLTSSIRTLITTGEGPTPPPWS